MCLPTDDSNYFEEVERVAKQLFGTRREDITCERVKAEIPNSMEYMKDAEKPPSLSCFVAKESWLIFDLLELKGDEILWLTMSREI